MQLFSKKKKKKKILDKTKNWEKVQTPEVVKVVLIKCTSADNQYKQKSEVLYIFTPNKPYGYLLILFRMDIFGTAHGWGGRKKAPFLKTCDTYPAMMKLGTLMPYLEKIQKICKSRDATPEFCWHQHFFHQK